MAWPFLFEVLEHMGFTTRWHTWIAALLSAASTKVLINGRQCRRICHARGLRQGDPLSPLLFVLVMEVLNALITEADTRPNLLYSRSWCMSLSPVVSQPGPSQKLISVGGHFCGVARILLMVDSARSPGPLLVPPNAMAAWASRTLLRSLLTR